MQKSRCAVKNEEKAFNFTQKRIEKLPRPESKRAEYRDEKTPGLTIRVTPTGKKTFYFLRRVDGRLTRLSLGSFPQMSVETARDKAANVQGDIYKGVDVISERRRARRIPTLKETFKQWADLHARAHRRSFKEDKRTFDKYLTTFHGATLKNITVAKVAAWHGRMGKAHGPIMANRALNLLRTIFNYSPKLGYAGDNPAGKGVTRFQENSRDRFLQEGEMKAFFTALKNTDQPWRDYISLLLFTGQRKMTVASMRWEDIDMEGSLWRIPKAKNKKPTTIPLTLPAKNILQTRLEARDDNTPWVFPSRNGGHLKDARKPWKSLLEEADLENLHLHDLRRSVGSWQARAGASLVVIGKSLGHADLKSTQIYSKLQNDDIRDSMELAISNMQKAALPDDESDETIDVDSKEGSDNE